MLRRFHNVNSVVSNSRLSRFGGALKESTLDRVLSTCTSEILRKK